METNDKDPGDKKWNNEQKLNEGFSGENIPDNYNPSSEDIAQRMKSEIETDQFGNETEVKRARFPHEGDEQFIFDKPDNTRAEGEPSEDNTVIENKKSLENRDHNYDSPKRYPESHPDNQKDRGNIKLDE